MSTMTMSRGGDSKAHFSLPSILAIVCAIAAFFVHAGTGLFLATVAIVAGVLGAVIALLPGVRGGVTSVFSIIAGVAGIVAAIIKLVL